MSVLVELGWAWCRVNGSGVAHLCPPVPMPRSRSACNRLPVWEASLLVTDAAPRCLACQAYGARGAEA